MKKLLTFYFLLLFSASLWAQIPAGYYDAADGKVGYELKSALNIITTNGYTTRSYTDLWTVYQTGDIDPSDNYIWDMYSENPTGTDPYNFTPVTEQCGNYSGESSCYNREHLMPQSVFNEQSPMVSDYHHIIPTDGYVNGRRSSYPFGEVASATWTSMNGSKLGLCDANLGYSGTVFEPINEYKGDIARSMLYFATRYETQVDSWSHEMLNGTENQVYKDWFIALLLKWHAQDPVSTKELNRNVAGYNFQGNANPFIDHPEYVEAIWGTAPVLTDPPTTPQSVSLSASSTSLTFNWGNVNYEDGYSVYRSLDNLNFTLAATVGANTLTYVDNNVVDAQIYYYNVVAYNVYGNSPVSNTVNGELSEPFEGGDATDLFFSEYIEGNSYNKALEISNFTGADLDLNRFSIKKQSNGAGDWSAGYALSGTIINGQSYVVSNSSAMQSILDLSDATTTATELGFNGNDAVSLWKDGVLIDVIGVFNDAANFAYNVTLVRNSTISSPNTSYATGEWTSYSIDYITDLSIHTFDGGTVTPPATCEVPTALSASNLTTTSADLSWALVADAVDYSLQYKAVSSSTWINAVPTTNSLDLIDLSPETQYEFQVATNCTDATSDYSASLLFVTTVDVPSVPQNLSLLASTTDLTLDWSDVNTETGYYVYRSLDNTAFSVLATLSANTVTYVDNSVTEAQMYYYNVVAFNTTGNSTVSATVSSELETPVVGGDASDLFFSEYVEGGSYNKALEVSNFTGASLDLSRYVIKKQSNGAGDWSAGYALSGSLANGGTYVAANSLATQAILDVSDATTAATELGFNGNDAVSLWKDGVLIDLIGTFNDAANYAYDVTIIRNSNVNSPNVTYTTTEWTTYSTDYIADLGSHTFDGGTVTPPATCDVPTSLLTNNLTATTADLSWAAVTDALDYSVQYKATSSSTWIGAVPSSNSLSLSGLSSETQYEFQVAANCSAATSEYSASTLFTTDVEPVVVISYCEPTGGTKFEWIDFVELSNLSNTSGQSSTGYSDFTSLVADVAVGETYSINFQAGFDRRSYTEYWSVWIDFNKDGDFSDAGENLAQGSTSDNSVYSLDIAIPADALLGETRLRIAMNDAGYYDACTALKYGEIEDYTVNITSLKIGGKENVAAQKATFVEPLNLTIYPNPAADYLSINKQDDTEVAIYSMSGQKVYQSVVINNTVDISQLRSGVYFLKLNDGGKITTHKLLKQ